jgi:hypothetical protein
LRRIVPRPEDQNALVLTRTNGNPEPGRTSSSRRKRRIGCEPEDGLNRPPLPP